MAGVWGVGFNHCGQIGPENKDPVRSSMGMDEPGEAQAQSKPWKPNTCWRLQQVPMGADSNKWEVQKACAGGDFTVVHGRSKQDEDGEVETWICGNLTHGRFCFSSCVLDKLTAIPALAGVAVRSMSCGKAHTLIATDTGAVYSWGWNMYGQLGQGNSGDGYAPTQIEFFRKAGIIARKVSCGESFSIVVCTEGLFSFGCNHKGQLGLGYAWATSTSNFPQRVCLDAQQELVDGDPEKASLVAHLDVACGGNHTLVLRTSGAAPPEIFSWGLNGEGQCGVGSLERLLQPMRVVIPEDLANDTPRAIACGMSHSIILARTGSAWSFGEGAQGQLGLGTTNSRMLPTRIEALREANVCSVICGMGHTMCLTEHGHEAFAWGTNQCGELGNGNGGVACSLEPRHVDLSTFFEGGMRRIEAIGSGPCANHSLVLTSGRLPWPITRVLLAGVLRGDPSSCFLARLPRDGNLSCSLLNHILDRVAAS